MEELNFGRLLKKYRNIAELYTLEEFAKRLADEGLIYSVSSLSRWENNHRIPNDRQLLLILLKIFIAEEAITEVWQAQEFLGGSGFGYLTSNELAELFEWKIEKPHTLIKEIMKSYPIIK
jgi:transcriptional regulator with XRE-family HTH domain